MGGGQAATGSKIQKRIWKIMPGLQVGKKVRGTGATAHSHPHLDRNVVGGQGLLCEANLLEGLASHRQRGVLGNGVSDSLGHKRHSPVDIYEVGYGFSVGL